MKTIIEEYGKIIIYAVIGVVVLGIVTAGIVIWYQQSYPNLETTSDITVTEIGEEPVILCESIELEKQDTPRTPELSSYIEAYEDSSLAVVIDYEIYGLDDVDITQEGTYQIICTATNSSGHSFTKRVSILVY